MTTFLVFLLKMMYCCHLYLLPNSLELSTDDMKLLEGQSIESSGKRIKRHEGMPAGGSTSLHGVYDKDTELCTVQESEERTTGLFCLNERTNFISYSF